MNTTTVARMTLGLAAGGFAAAWLLTSAPAGAAGSGVAGKVTFLQGAAKHGADEGSLKPLKRNDDVKEGELLKTEAGARLEIKLGDGSLVRLAPGSTLKLGLAKVDAMKEGEAAQSKLTAGKMWASISKAVGGESKFAVRTENAVAGVRGTTFRVNAEEDESTVVKVYEGAVAVSNGPLVEKQKAGGAAKKGPIDWAARKQVAAPFKEVSLQEWEKIVGKMMEIRVAANGAVAEPAEFTAAADGKDAADREWVAWNQEMDTKGAPKSK